MTTERALDAWFARQAARERTAVRIEDALLGGRFARYFVYRLRFFAIRYVAASLVQLVKVLVLHRVLGTNGFFVVIALVAAAGLVAGGWWGALEVLRVRVRLLYRFESPTAVGREVARWVVAAGRIALVLGVAAGAWLIVRLVADGGLRPVDLAVAAVTLRSAVDLPIRAYHAGAFALRRVYRPWSSILALEAVGLGTLLVLVPVVGAWAVGLAELVMAAAFGAVAVRYAARTHRLLGLAPQRLITVQALLGRREEGKRRKRGRRGGVAWRQSVVVIREVAGPAAAGMAMTLDSLVILAVVSAASIAREPWLAVLMAGVSPTVRAGFDWAQLIYFDLKRLDAQLFDNLRRALDRATLHLALVLGAAFAAVALIVAVGPLGVVEPAVGALVPFLVAASVLGLVQMQAFTEGAYPRVIVGGLVLVGGVLSVRPLAAVGVEPLIVLASATGAALVAVALARRWPRAEAAAAEPLLPTAWLALLRAQGGPVLIGVARIRAAAPIRANGAMADPVLLREWQAMQLGRRLARRARRSGAAAVVDAQRVAWFVRDEARPAVTRRAVILDASGRVSELLEAHAADGPAGIAALAAWRLFPTDRGAEWDADRAAGLDAVAVERQFRATVPGGIVFAPDRSAPPELTRLTSVDRRLVLWDAIRHARRLPTRPNRGGRDVTAWAPDGTLRLVFIAPPSAGRRAIARWRRFIRRANLVAASGGVLPVGASAGTSARALARSSARPSAVTSSRVAPTTLTQAAIVGRSTPESAPTALAASAATESRHG